MIVSGSGTRDSPIAIDDDDSEDEVLNELVNVSSADISPPPTTLSPRRGTFLAELPPHLLSDEVARDLEHFREELQLQVKKRKRGVTPWYEGPNGSSSNPPRLPLGERLSESRPEGNKRAKKRRKKNREAAKAEVYIQRNKPYEMQSNNDNPSEHGRYTLLSLESEDKASFTVDLPMHSNNTMTTAALPGPFDHSTPLNHTLTPRELPPTHVPPANKQRAAEPQPIFKSTRLTSLTNQQPHYPTSSARPSSAQPPQSSGFSVPPGDPLLWMLPPLVHVGPSTISHTQIDTTLHTIPMPMVNAIPRERQRPPHMTLPTSSNQRSSTTSHVDKRHINQQNLPILPPPPGSLPPKPTFLPSLQPQSKHAPTAPTATVPIGKPNFVGKRGIFPILSHMLPNPEQPYFPNVECTLIMEQMPKTLCNVAWITAWSQKACGATPLCILLGVQKALVEYRSTDLAVKAWGSPRLGADEHGKQLNGHGAEYQIAVYWYKRDLVEEDRLSKVWAMAALRDVNANTVPLSHGEAKEGVTRLKQGQGQQGKSKGGLVTSSMSGADRDMWATIEASKVRREELARQRKAKVEREQKHRAVEGGVPARRGKEGDEKPGEVPSGCTVGKEASMANRLEREAGNSERREQVNGQRREREQGSAREKTKLSEKGKQEPPAKLTEKDVDVLKRVAANQQKQQQQRLAPSLAGRPTQVTPEKDSTIQKPPLAPRNTLSTQQRPPPKHPITSKLSSLQTPSSAVPHHDFHNKSLSQTSDAVSRKMDLDPVPSSSMTLPLPISSSAPPLLPITPCESALKSLSLQGGVDMDTSPDHAIIPAAGTYFPPGKHVDDNTESAKIRSKQEPAIPGLLLDSRPIPTAPRSFFKPSQNLSRPSLSSTTPLDGQMQNSSRSHLSKKQDSVAEQQKVLGQKLVQAKEELAQGNRSRVSMDLDSSVSSDISNDSASQRTKVASASQTVVAGEEKLTAQFHRTGEGLLKQRPERSASLTVPVSGPSSRSITPTAEGSRQKSHPSHHPRPEPAAGSESRRVDLPVAPAINSVTPVMSSSSSTYRPSIPTPALKGSEKHEPRPLGLTLDSSSLQNYVAQRLSSDDMEISPVSPDVEPAVPQDKSEGPVTTVHVSAQAGLVMSAAVNQVQQQKQSSGSIASTSLDVAPLQAPNTLRMISKQSLAAKQKLLEEEIKATKVLMAQIAKARTKQEREGLMAMLREKSRSMDDVSNSIKSDALVSTGQYSQQMKRWLRVRWPESREDVGVLIISDDEDEADGPQNY